MTEVEQMVRKSIGETNLYKIDPWKDPNKACKHNNSVFCVKCREELEKESNDK